MVKKKGRKKKGNRRLIGLSILAFSGLAIIGLATQPTIDDPVVHLFQQETEQTVQHLVPQILISQFGEAVGTKCSFSSILFYITSDGDRIQGDIDIAKKFISPLEAASLVSRFTGKTIDRFETDVFMTCRTLSGYETYNMVVTGGQFRNLVIADDSDGTTKKVHEIFQRLSGTTNIRLIDDRKTFIDTIITPARQIENSLNQDILSFDTTIQFILNYQTEMTIDGEDFIFDGIIKNNYKVSILNNQGTATPREPTNTDLKLVITNPSSKVVVSGNIWDFRIEIIDWDKSEGFPSLTIQDFNKRIIFTKDIPLSGANRDVSLFADRFQFPGKTSGQYKISASVPAFRPIATDYIEVVQTNEQVPKTPDPPMINPSGLIQCLQGFTAQGTTCVQDFQQLFIDPNEFLGIFGAVLNSLIPIVVGIIVLIVIILIISAFLKRAPKRFGGFGGGGQTIIRLGRGGGGNRGPTNGRGGIKPNGALPKGFTKRTGI